MYVEYNPNPKQKRVGDCVIRAICKVLDMDWETVFCGLATEGYIEKDVISSNSVWSKYLTGNGFKRYFLDNNCPLCFTVDDFAKSHPKGKYVVGTGTHAVAVVDGDVWDAWDSRNEIPLYYFSKEESMN